MIPAGSFRRRRGVAPQVWATLVALFLFSPADTTAQPWLLGKGKGGAKLIFFSHSTDEEFILSSRRIGATVVSSGTKQPYPLGGESTSRAYLLELSYGALDFLDVRALLSSYDLQYNDDGGDRRNTGPGDTRLELVADLPWISLPAAARAAVKAPTGEFTIDPQRVPLGEDQWDVEGALSLGLSLFPPRAYAKGEVGYRYRFENRDTKIKPGNEIFFLVEGGGKVTRRFAVKLALEGLFARPRENREFGFLVKNADGRRAIAVAPFATFHPTDRILLEMGARFLVSGRDYPAGAQYVVAGGWHLRP